VTDPIEPHERFRYHGVDPADLVAAEDEAAERVARILASLKASWTVDALCIGEPLHHWFPGKGESNRHALEVCGRCPSRLPCLAEAIADPDLDHGIRGGATVAARKAMRANRTNGHSSITHDHGTREAAT
jgi:hypothetical protein